MTCIISWISLVVTPSRYIIMITRGSERTSSSLGSIPGLRHASAALIACLFCSWCEDLLSIGKVTFLGAAIGDQSGDLSRDYCVIWPPGL